MDVNRSMPILKKQNVVGEFEAGTEDRISQLPDHILHHVLSLLPTKDAVATCTLATRWQNLWTSITKLDFTCKTRYSGDQKWKNSFTRFVERVLLFHSSIIKTFNLSSTYLDAACVNSWISVAVERQVQELRLSFSVENGDILFLPACLCTSTRLTLLKVEVQCDLKLPATICFSSLKTLYLRNVKFCDDASVHKLFSGLQVLEDLKLVTCNWDNITTATISVPSLRSLTLEFASGSRSDIHCKLMVHGENLLYLDCKSNFTIDLLLDVPLLIEADIGLILKDSWEWDPVAALHVTKLFTGIRCAKTLYLSDMNVEHLFRTTMEYISAFPTFDNLTTLDLVSAMTNCNNEPLMGILQNSPILESIVIERVFDAGHRVDVSAKWRKFPVPQCFKCSLTSCRLMEFDGDPNEYNLIRFLLKTACVLKSMKIYCSSFLTDLKIQDITMQLTMAPRKSKSCVVEIFMHNGSSVQV